jgi:hypothetical protein
MTDKDLPEVEAILTDAFNSFYDYITEKDIIKAAHEYSEKTVYKIALARINKLLIEARIDELKRLPNTKPVWFDPKIHTSYIDKRIKELEGKDND